MWASEVSNLSRSSHFRIWGSVKSSFKQSLKRSKITRKLLSPSAFWIISVHSTSSLNVLFSLLSLKLQSHPNLLRAIEGILWMFKKPPASDLYLIGSLILSPSVLPRLLAQNWPESRWMKSLYRTFSMWVYNVKSSKLFREKKVLITGDHDQA